MYYLKFENDFELTESHYVQSLRTVLLVSLIANALYICYMHDK